MKILKGGLLAAMLMVLAGGINPASAAQCFTVKFIDKNGVVVPTPQPVVGIMVGGRPAVDGVVPTNVSIQPGAPAPCPEALIKSVRDTFEESCPTIEKRKRAAQVNNVDSTIIDKGCRDSLDALK
jgi:hypothetical protein